MATGSGNWSSSAAGAAAGFCGKRGRGIRLARPDRESAAAQVGFSSWHAFSFQNGNVGLKISPVHLDQVHLDQSSSPVGAPPPLRASLHSSRNPPPQDKNPLLDPGVVIFPTPPPNQPPYLTPNFFITPYLTLGSYFFKPTPWGSRLLCIIEGRPFLPLTFFYSPAAAHTIHIGRLTKEAKLG